MLRMLVFDDPRWDGLRGAYHVVYDPRGALRALAETWADDRAWAALWNELHHQGDVDGIIRCDTGSRRLSGTGDAARLECLCARSDD
jgi:hypothetical protein